jgi:GNAT superfamily N-acetyltransferase
MDDVVVGPIDLMARVDDALEVQALAFGLAADEVAIRRQIVLRHLAYRGARALGAITGDGRLVGFVYGMPNDRGHQGQGIGRRLLPTITDTVTEPRSILSAIDADSPARHLYRSLGYTDLARPVHFPSAARPYAVMGAALPLRR